VVTAEIRANVNLRIALRVRDQLDSDDVVDAPDAALLPAHRPGRGLFRTGGGPLVEFQAARATGRATAAASPRVWPLRHRHGIATGWRRQQPIGGVTVPAETGHTGADHSRAGLGPDDLAMLVATCRQSAAQEAVAPVCAPWLPPLPMVIRPHDLPSLLGRAAGQPPPLTNRTVNLPPLTNRMVNPRRSPTPDRALVLTLGVADLPELQARAPSRGSFSRAGTSP
jgi:S-DNA-T family DNA segregation ATPase FtsK/SpoIIIE